MGTTIKRVWKPTDPGKLLINCIGFVWLLSASVICLPSHQSKYNGDGRNFLTKKCEAHIDDLTVIRDGYRGEDAWQCKWDPNDAQAYGGQRCCFGYGKSNENMWKKYSETFKMEVYSQAFPKYNEEKLLKGFRNYYPQNKLWYYDETMAQEGRSFCIVGEHYRQTALYEFSRGFQTLANRFFDIGNHIHPFDSTKMNVIEYYEVSKYGGSVQQSHQNGYRNVLENEADLAKRKTLTEEFNEVFFGTSSRPHRSDNGRTYCPAPHYEWQPREHKQDFRNRPPSKRFQKHKNCVNPYRVKVSRIMVDGIQFQNYLHIKVYADQTNPLGSKCPTGKMQFLMLEVRDQDGFPVGQFTDDIPCHETPCVDFGNLKCQALYGKKKNILPCMFTHHLSTVHPSIFMASANDSGVEYLTEVHTSWRFAQSSSHYTTELHFATMIVEDDTPVRYYTSRSTDWEGVFGCGRRDNRHGDVSYSIQPNTNCCYNWGTRCCERDWWGKGGKYCLCCCGCDDSWRCCPGCCCGYSCKCSRNCYVHQVGWIDGEYMATDDGDLSASISKFYHCGISHFGSINYHADMTNNTDRPYGYSARYNSLFLKPNSMGGWDHLRRKYIRHEDIDCHADIPDNDPYFGITEVSTGTKYSKLVPRKKMFTKFRDLADHNGELRDYMTPGRDQRSRGKSNNPNLFLDGWAYVSDKPERVLKRALTDIWNDPAIVTTPYSDITPPRSYHGTRFSKLSHDAKPDSVALAVSKLSESFGDMMEKYGARCPCPYNPTTLPPELETKPPTEVQARQLHATNMLIAWIVLIPLAFFVTRYYKETFSRVFFLQEFWWYTIHGLSLSTALLFMGGSFYAMWLKRRGTDYEITFTNATRVHVVLGYVVLVVYIIHLLLGSFRAWNVNTRIVQMALHWGIGWFEYLLTVVAIIAAGAIPQGLLNCAALYTYLGFIVFQLCVYVYMEYQMRVWDALLNLTPPRDYFPSPTMRVFHTDAPGSAIRMVILVLYFLTCLMFYTALHILTNKSSSQESCIQNFNFYGDDLLGSATYDDDD